METSFDEQLKCKQCGALLYPHTAVDGVIDCEYCHTIYTVAVNSSKEVGELLLIAGNLLDDCKFDSAYATYSRAAALSPKESEAYFGMALAEHRVQYLKDYRKKDNGQRFRLQPICHEISEKKFLDNENYKKAITFATPTQLLEYQQKAEELDHIRSEFLRLKKSGLDYDCFICVKVTDDQTGRRTNDFKSADDIYFELKGKGYKVFFSERELTNEIGVDYEAFVLYALYMSECMIVVCSNEEYLDTPWVKNEYTRFIGMINDEQKESGSIAIAFSGKPIEHLPNRAGKLQGINLSSLGAMEQIIGFVQKYYADNGNSVSSEAVDEVERFKAKLQTKQTIRLAKAQAKQDKWKARQIELQAKREAKQEELKVKQTELDIKRTKQQAQQRKNTEYSDLIDDDNLDAPVRDTPPLTDFRLAKKLIGTIAIVVLIIAGFFIGNSFGKSSGGLLKLIALIGGGIIVISNGLATIKNIWKNNYSVKRLIGGIITSFILALIWGFLFGIL